jgi:hypothetical protein
MGRYVSIEVFSGSLVQGDSREKISVLAGDSIDHCEKKKVNMNVCIIVSGYRDRTHSEFCFWGLMKSEVYKRKWIYKTNCWLALWMFLPA